MDTVLKLVRDRMQADSMTRHETVKESFFCACSKTIKGLDLTQHHEYDTKTYTVYQDNEGFGIWLAYQVGLQMMWRQISGDKNKKKAISEAYLDNTDLAFKTNFQFFYEEKFWRLA